MQQRPHCTRGRYFDPMGAFFPRGAREQIKAAADREGVSVAAFMRQAVADRVEKACGSPRHRLEIV